MRIFNLFPARILGTIFEKEDNSLATGRTTGTSELLNYWSALIGCVDGRQA